MMRSTLIFLMLAAPFAAAGPIRDHAVEAELVCEMTALQPGGTTTVALRVKHDPGWHTYWKNPGLAGVPISIRWELPEGFEAGPIQWAPPQRVKMATITTYGYEGEVLLLTDITVPEDADTTKPARLVANISWMMCSKTCVPSNPVVSTRIPVAPEAQPHPQWHDAIAAARAKLPKPSDAWSLKASLAADGKTVTLAAKPGKGAASPTDVYFFSGERVINSDAKQAVAVGDDGIVRLALVVSEYGPENPSRLSGVLHSATSWEADAELTDMVVDIPLDRRK